MDTSAISYPAPFPHDPIVKIADDVFMVRGSVRMNALMRITRNMAIVRHENSLTLINPIRLSASGEKELRALGQVNRIIRLGCFHGLDDPYYVDQFNAEFWCQSGGKTYQQPSIDVEVGPRGPLPFPDAELVPFESTRQPEAVLLLKRGNGLLLTCDSIQHYGDYRHNSLLARIVMPFTGFPRTTLIGPNWLKYQTPRDASLQRDFERLLELDFDSLLSAHGSFREHGAKRAVRSAIQKTFD